MNLKPKNIEVKSWKIALLLLCLLGYFYFIHVPPVMNDKELLFWGYLHILLHGLSIILYFRKDNVKSSYPFIALFSFFQLIAFGIPVFVIKKSKFLFASPTTESLEYAFFAYLIFYLAYWLLSIRLFRNMTPFASMNELPIKKIRIILFLFLLLIVIGYFNLVPVLSQLIGLIKNVYIGLALLLLIKKQSKRWEIVSFITVLLIEIVNRVVSGLIAEVAVLLLFVVVVMYICSIRIVFLLILIVPFVLFYTAFSKVKFSYRQAVWFTKKKYSIDEKIFIIYNLTQKESKSSSKKYDKEGSDNFFNRYAYPSSIFSRVLKATPSRVPYWEGETYIPIFTKFIPRALWPDKPVENLGHDFGVRYGILQKSDKTTSINTPVIVEMYVNFGVTGLYVGCALLGFLFLFLDRYFNSNKVSIENKIINSSITFSLLILEGNFSIVFGNLFLICLVFYFTFKFAKVSF